MSISSFFRGIVDRFRMTTDCVYDDAYIRLYEGIADGEEIPAAVKTRWKTESDKNVRELWALKEREHIADKAQRAYAAGLEPVEAFPEPELVEPVPIDEAANSPSALKQIQVDLSKLRKHVDNDWETATEVFNNVIRPLHRLAP